MNNQLEKNTAADYEERYQRGYGLIYPESHLIRVHRHILEWELNIQTGNIFDFGCGTGGNLKYFAEQGYVPFGCDTSQTAIEKSRRAMPTFARNFQVTDVAPNLLGLVPKDTANIFMSNQVLYFLENASIRAVVEQAHQMVRRGGVFIATMMAFSCWYFRHVTCRTGDFYRIELDTPRQSLNTMINFKDRNDLENLFEPFRKLHIGSYGSCIREDEGSTDHWIYVGIRD